MSALDGYLGATVKVVDHGPNAARWNLVILGDGYRASELGKYHDDVQKLLDKMFATVPYHELWCGINVHRIDVVSTDSGADDPLDCPDPEGTVPTGATPLTYYDAEFCSNSTVGRVHRVCNVDGTRARADAVARVPELDAAIVLINSPIYGGAGGIVPTCTAHPLAADIAIHEIGHSAFGLADEYGGAQVAAAGEPYEPNVTANSNRATIKWGALIDPATPLPSSCNAGCATCIGPAAAPPPDAVGAYGGAKYVDCGYFRPLSNCKMRQLSAPFCPVCAGVIRDTIQPFLPAETFDLITPSIQFQNVPEGVGGVGVTIYRAIVLEGHFCQDLTFEISAGPTGGFGTPFGTAVLVEPSEYTSISSGRLGLSYTSTADGATASGTVTVRAQRGAITLGTWIVNIHANTVARPQSAITLVLDHSGSMSDEAGDGTTKVQKLREAVNAFIGLMKPGDGLAIVRFDNTAQELMPVTDVGAEPDGPGRLAAIGHVNSNALDPAGGTSIGAGVVVGKATSDAAVATPPYAVKALLVLTDGLENTPPYLNAVSPSISANTFAIGFGTPYNISTDALNQLTQSHQGYLLITGLITPDQSARLSKYFVQILAGITNANVILDPRSLLSLGGEHRVGFDVTETDIGLDVIVLSPLARFFEFFLLAPDGTRIDPSSSKTGPLAFVQQDGVAFYRCGLPAVKAAPLGSHAGLWRVVLRLSRKTKDALPRLIEGLHKRDPQLARLLSQGVVPYDLIVHSQTDLRLQVQVEPSGSSVGATLSVRASLREYSVPVENRATVWAETTWPNQSVRTLALREILPGQFEAQFKMSASGLYTLRVRAQGQTFRATRFRREQTLTAAVYPAGYEHPTKHDGQLCDQ